MPQPKKAGRFGGTAAHHKHIMANLATELFRHGRVRTTQAKAKTVQPIAERMVTFAKRGDIHARRQVLKVIRDRDVVHKLFADVAPTFADRDGGYTRVLKLGPRKGDAAPMVVLELVEGVTGEGAGTLEEAPRRRWGLRRQRGTQARTARTRAEVRAAAADRGEFPEPVDAELEPDAGEEPTPAAAEDDEERPEADPAEVEARLAAEEEAAAGEAGEHTADADEAGQGAADADEAGQGAADADEDEGGRR